MSALREETGKETLNIQNYSPEKRGVKFKNLSIRSLLLFVALLNYQQYKLKTL